MLILLKTLLYIFYDYFRSQKIQNVSSVDTKYFDIIKKKLKLKKNKNKEKILICSFIHHPGYVYTDCLILSNLKLIRNFSVHSLLYERYNQGKLFFDTFGSEKNIFLPENCFKKKIKYLFVAFKYFYKMKNVNDLINFKINDIDLGRAVYDHYIRNSKTPTLNYLNYKLLFFLTEAFYIKSFSEEIFKENKYKYAIISERQFIPSNIIFQVALKKKVQVISRISGPKKIGVTITEGLKNKNKSETRVGKVLFNKLVKSKKKNLYSKRGLNLINNLMNKEINNNQSTNKNIFLKKIGLDPSKNTCFVFSHNLLDGNLFGKTNIIYNDYLTWLRETLNFLNNLNNKNNWIIKEHPSDYGFSKMTTNTYKEFKKIIHKDNIKFFPKSMGNSIIKEVADCVITLGGTVGMEYPCYGIPSINSSGIFYSGYGFTNDFNNKREYFEYLKNINNVIKKKLTIKQIELARIHYYIIQELIKIDYELLYDYDITRNINENLFLKKVVKLIDNNKNKIFFNSLNRMISKNQSFLINSQKV